MNEDMKKYYCCEAPEVDVDTIQIGNVFAIQNEEKKWRRCEKEFLDREGVRIQRNNTNAFSFLLCFICSCRGLVIRVMKELDEVSFRCIDYGDLVTVNFRNIHILMPCFRRLPVQAIKAELAGT